MGELDGLPSMGSHRVGHDCSDLAAAAAMYILHMIHKIYMYLQDIHAAATAKSLQLCPTLCDPIDGSPSGSPVPGILQARLEWLAISFSNA